MARIKESSKVSGLVGVVSPAVLSSARELNLNTCPILEIRYDLFPNTKEWPELISRIKAWAPKAKIIATIRLERDGGKWPEKDSKKREALWSAILNASQAPDWIDLEWAELEDYMELMAKAQEKDVKVLASHHDFQGIPSATVLEKAIEHALYWRADGFKIAAMSKQPDDCGVLYALSKKHAASFTWFSAFAMGETGTVSRIYSFACGANLSYGALGDAVAPGQLSMPILKSFVAKLNGDSSEADVRTWLKEEGVPT